MTNQDTTLKCPKCGAAVPLTESLAAPMVAAVRAEMQARVDAATRAAEQAVKDAETKERLVEATIKNRVQEREQALRDEAAREAAESVRAVHTEVDALRAKLVDAQAAQAAALRKERELEEARRELELTVQRRVTEESATMYAKASADADASWRLKLVEREQTIEAMQAKLAEAQRKAEQGSQQLQGEVQELDLEAGLRARFTLDEIGEVAKGVRGADVCQTVLSPSGARCGVILWESKRTKSFSPAWLPKLREDGRAAKADLLVLVSATLPDEVSGFDAVDNVWVTTPALALPLAAALRTALLGAHAVRQAQEGMRTKSEEVYAYVTGPQFRHRVEALVEAFTTLQADLEAEKRAALKQWAKREAQVTRVMESTTGMFGDLQGIAGRALPEPEGLMLEAAK